MEIVAACIPKSPDEWRQFVAKVGGAADAVHLDVCDGKFVPSRSWPIDGDQAEWARFVATHDLLGEANGHDFEADLMVENPVARFREFVDAGFNRIIVHWESLGENPAAALEQLVADERADVWLAASLDTDPAQYLGELGFVAGFQCMGIARVGFQGEPFDERALGVVQLVHATKPELPISIDGGVSEATIGRIAASGVRRVVAGSAFVRADDAGLAAEALRGAAERE